MTGLERFQAMLDGRPADRRFVVLNLSLYGARLTGCPLSRYYTDASEYVRGQQAAFEEFGFDLAIAPFCLGAEAEALGCTVRMHEEQPPAMVRPALESAERIDTLAMPDIDGHPRLLYIRESVRLLRASLGNRIPVAAVVSGPFDLPAFLLGFEGWLETLLFHPERVPGVLDFASRFFVGWANALLGDGANLLVLTTGCANPVVVDDSIVSGVATPALRSTLSMVKGPVLLHHTGSPFMRALPYFRDLPKVGGFVLDERDDMLAARERVGEAALLLCGMAGPTLDGYRPEDVREKYLGIIREAGKDPRVALATTAADVPLCTPPETIHAILLAAGQTLQET